MSHSVPPPRGFHKMLTQDRISPRHWVNWLYRYLEGTQFNPGNAPLLVRLLLDERRGRIRVHLKEEERRVNLYQ